MAEDYVFTFDPIEIVIGKPQNIVLYCTPEVRCRITRLESPVPIAYMSPGVVGLEFQAGLKRRWQVRYSGIIPRTMKGGEKYRLVVKAYAEKLS